jgi:hypothetical protein
MAYFKITNLLDIVHCVGLIKNTKFQRLDSVFVIKKSLSFRERLTYRPDDGSSKHL